MTATLPTNSWLSFPLSGVDANGNPAAIHGTITISDYTKAYVASAGGGSYAVVPKTPAPEGGSYLVSAVVNATDAASGIALPAVQLDVTVQGPPNPTQVAVAAVIGAVNVQTPINMNTPADTGQPSITF